MTAVQMIENQDLPYNIKDMLLKLRKGAAASFNAARYSEVFEYLPGWSIAKAKLVKPSKGGWIIKDVPGYQFYKSYQTSTDGRIHLTASILSADVVNDETVSSDDDQSDLDKVNALRASLQRNADYRKRDQDKIDTLLNRVLPSLIELSTKTQKKWNVRDVQTGVRPASYRHEEHFVSFELLVECGASIITAPDGQTFEVFGDYKNEPVNAKTFVNFYDWAVENTSLIHDVLDVLGMEPVPVKDDLDAPYVPPKSAPESVMRVYNHLKEVTATIRAEQKAELIIQYAEDLNAYVRLLNVSTTSKETLTAYRQQIGVLSRRAVTEEKTLTENWETEVEKYAEQQVEIMQNRFVRKNTGKLSSIVEAKGNLKEIQNLRVNVNHGLIVGEMLFVFEDGSQFSVSNSIERSYTTSRFGGYTEFYRFPTRFHDIVLADGTKVGSPSEERVNTIFCGKDPE